MDADKLSKLEEKLYSETPFFGDRNRQQAAKELAENRSASSIEVLTRALTFSKDKNLKKTVFNTIRKIKLQDQELVTVVCKVWAEYRDVELGGLLKIKGWVARNPLSLRLLTAVNLGWQGILEEKGIEIVKPLLSLLHDSDVNIQNTARQWASSFTQPELQEEVCRLASEENNQDALVIATEAGYAPTEPSQSALFQYFTRQWGKLAETDPDYKLLEETYYNAPTELKNRIDEYGKSQNRPEWAWIVLGGQEIRRAKEISFSYWNDIIEILSTGKQWETLWQLINAVPAILAKNIVKKLKYNRWLPKQPADKQKLAQLTQLITKMKQSTVPKGNLVRCVHTLTGHTQPIEAIAISSDGKVLYSAGDQIIRVWNQTTGELKTTLQGHLKSVTTLCLNQDNSILASGSRDKTVCLWRVPNGNLLSNLSANPASVWCLDMTDDASVIASGSYQEIRLWQYPSSKLLKTLRGHKREVECTLISPDNQLLVTAGGKSDNIVKVWDLSTGENRFTLEGHQDGIWCVDICPQSQVLATGSLDHTIKIWSLTNGEETATLEGHQGRIWCLKITPDGKKLITGSDDGCVNIWQLATGKLIHSLKSHTDAVWCLDISSQGDVVATGGKDATVRLWDIEKGEQIGLLAGHVGGIRSVKITSDGQTLVTGSNDLTLKIWQWDLSRLYHLPLVLITEEDRQWIAKTKDHQEITKEEQQWLNFLGQLTNITVQ